MIFMGDGKGCAREAFSLPHLIDYQSEDDFLAALPVNFVAMGTVGVVVQKCQMLLKIFFVQLVALNRFCGMVSSANL